MEIEIKEDKQGLNTSKRNKKRLEALAHNVLVWARQRLAPACPKIARQGIQRLVRDVFRIYGLLFFDQTFNLLCVILNKAAPFANELSIGLASLLAQEHVAVSLGETYVAIKM